MTAPDMASPLDAGSLEKIIRDACEMTPYWVEGKPETHQDPYENAARAVLAAISEAGAVEVVTGYGVKLKSGDVERCGTIISDAKECMADMVGWHDDYYNPVEVVTRTTTTITHRTPWEALG